MPGVYGCTSMPNACRDRTKRKVPSHTMLLGYVRYYKVFCFVFFTPKKTGMPARNSEISEL